MSPLATAALIVACAPVFIIGLALANAILQTWLGSDDDAD